MPVALTIVALTLVDLAEVDSGLSWRRLDTAAGQPIGARTIAAATDPEFRALCREIPRTAGVYAWTADPRLPSPDRWARTLGPLDLAAEVGEVSSTVPVAGDPDDAVIYIGVGAGRGGIYGRLIGELRGIRNQQARGRSPRYRQRFYPGHPRTILERDARLHYAMIPAGDDDPRAAAKATERMLLHYCRFATGSVLLVNGSGWSSYGTDHDHARARRPPSAARTCCSPAGPARRSNAISPTPDRDQTNAWSDTDVERARLERILEQGYDHSRLELRATDRNRPQRPAAILFVLVNGFVRALLGVKGSWVRIPPSRQSGREAVPAWLAPPFVSLSCDNSPLW